jgi:hypothetical protein
MLDVAGVAPRGIWFNPPPRDYKRITELGRENTHWRRRAERAEALVELQKQIAALLGTPLPTETS